MTHRGPFQPLPFCDSVIHDNTEHTGGYFTTAPNCVYPKTAEAKFKSLNMSMQVQRIKLEPLAWVNGRWQEVRDRYYELRKSAAQQKACSTYWHKWATSVGSVANPKRKTWHFWTVLNLFCFSEFNSYSQRNHANEIQPFLNPISFLASHTSGWRGGSRTEDCSNLIQALWRCSRLRGEAPVAAFPYSYDWRQTVL